MSDRAAAFHATPPIGVFLITGGGAKFIEELMGTPGASSSVLDLQIPYAYPALEQLLGRAPEQACSALTARQMAVTAFTRAQHLAPDQTHRFGFGLTASLATNRTKKGQHRAFWAIQLADRTNEYSALFDADRETEEGALNEFIWASLNHCLFDHALSHDITAHSSGAHPEWSSLLSADPHRICIGTHNGHALLPGSFNPLHDGHREMRRVGEAIAGKPVAYEITVRNADKPGLDLLSLQERLPQFETTPVWITNTPTFSEKAELFPGATFLLGVDTIRRLGMQKFYQNDARRMGEALDRLAALNTQFIVFGRVDGDQFISLEDLDLPATLRERCTAVSEDVFRNDLSSTALRAQQSGGR